jgi:hypothetical protein
MRRRKGKGRRELGAPPTTPLLPACSPIYTISAHLFGDDASRTDTAVCTIIFPPSLNIFIFTLILIIYFIKNIKVIKI